MSKDKLYAVKNDDGKYWDFNDLDGFWQLGEVICPFTVSEENAKNTVKEHGGHVVTLVEEPEKVVLTKEQAETVEHAHTISCPAFYISAVSGKDEELLMSAYVNGYTVAKETKYLVYKGLGGKHKANVQYAQACRVPAHPETFSWIITSWIINDQSARLTAKETIDFGLQDCGKEEVTDDNQ